MFKIIQLRKIWRNYRPYPNRQNIARGEHFRPTKYRPRRLLKLFTWKVFFSLTKTRQLHPLSKGWAQEYSRKFKHPYWHEKHISNCFFQTKLTDWHALFIKTCNKHFFYLFSICAKERKKSIYFRLLCYQLTRKENPRNRVLRPVMQPKLFSLLKKYPLPDSLSISWIKNNIGCLKESLFFVLDND